MNSNVNLHVIECSSAPLIGPEHLGSSGNLFGYEGGTAFRLDGQWHLITAEMCGKPINVKRRLGHWTSGNRLGYTTSTDGRKWSAARFLDLSAFAPWWADLRTPVGIEFNADGQTFSMLFTAWMRDRGDVPFAGVGHLRGVLQRMA